MYLGQVLYHELLAMLFHIRANKTGQVEIGTAIKVELVLEHLMNSICWCTVLWNAEFGNLRGAVIAS